MALPGFLHNAASRPVSRWFLLAVLMMAALLVAGCDQTGQMIDQARYDPLEESALFADRRSARPMVAGAVPYAGDAEIDTPADTGLDENGEMVEGFPVEVNQELVELGQERYKIFCVPCHGAAGEGNGMAVTFGVPKPPSLLDDNARNMTSGQLFDIITNGRGNMFPYAYRVKPDERWAVIAYMRALQLKNEAVAPADLTPEDIQQIGNQP